MCLYSCSNLKLKIWLESHFTGRWLSPKNAIFNGKIPFLWLANTGVEPPFSKISLLKLQNYWSHAGQVKQKVNCGKFSPEFSSVRIAAHKERPALNMAKFTWKSKFHLGYLLTLSFQQEPSGASCKARISRSLVLTRINLKTCRII